MTKTTLYLLGALCAASGAAVLVTQKNGAAGQRPRRPAALSAAPDAASRIHIDAARGFNHGSALLAFSALADSAVEHYRGSFENPAMYTPLVSAACSLVAGLHGGQDKTEASHDIRHAVYLAAAAAGTAGTAFHLYNVTKRPGGFSWHNLFYGAPLGAPMSLLLSGALGAVGERLRNEPALDPRLFGMPAGKALALAAGIGLVGTVAEVGLLHFRGAFQHRAMYAPVTIAPLAAAMVTHAALTPPRDHWIARIWLRVTAALGVVGTLFHARGIARSQGGWRNWSQNILAGPPLPAPPSFTALAIAGLAALRLRRTEHE
ncbi:hypothetical protein [Paraburkholderia rhizosphaerae]|uniref:Uncharacterized protein n=1 Tax=Paraburkholderia rhizosphaerae TaxID=480658 RepID=A0A4R8L8E8_9BURK|nr:hypothetical protein [Paraburkholderia rhizosphaerae]TDY39046.1 hypothetical protein BX592_12850 [Paraburkholderia rhizosphaerae]